MRPSGKRAMTTAPGMSSFNRSDILRTFQIFHNPGDIRELRILNAGKFRTISGYFDDAGAMTDAVVGVADEPFPAYYFTLNPVRRDLFARSANKYTKYAKETTADADIIERRWLPIDLDPIRPAGISSNEEEHAAAIQKAKDIKEWLISRGWPAGAFILADSGNGGHLVVKIDLPNDETSRDLVKRCLDALDATFSDDIVKVDTTSYNAARIWKIYGTAARKGSDIEDRPHRIAKILEAPNELVTVSREQLEELAAIKAPKERPVGDNHRDFDPVRYAEEHGATVVKVKSGWVDPKGKKWTLAILEECPFNSNHDRGEAWIGVADSGERGFGCPHDGCRGNDWHALRDLWEPDRKFSEVDDPNPHAISEEELNAYSLPSGPKFNCQLPKEHFIQRFMAYGSDISDAYTEYWFAAGVFILAVIADKKIKIVLKQGTIYPNVYISINGKSSLARKSTVVDTAESMLCQVKPSLLPAMVPTEFSPEAFTEHMSDYNHALWIRDEAAGVLGLMKRDYMRGFKDSLMQLYDCKPFYRKLRTSQRKGSKTEFRVDDPYLNLLWATTDASLGANTEQNDTLSGFMARFIFFFPQGKKEKWLPLEEGTAANSVFEEVVRNQLADIASQLSEMQECQAMHFSQKAATYYTEWQRIRENEWTASNDGNAMQIYSRLAPTVIKLSLLFELGMPGFDPSRPIRFEFVEEACRLVDSYFMPTAMAVYELVGANAEKNVIDRIVAYLKKHGGKATRRDILKDVKIKNADFDDFLSTMVESGTVEIKTVKRSGKGRDSVYVLLANVSNVSNVANVANVANVEEIRPDSGDGGIKETMATMATMATLATMATMACKSGESGANGTDNAISEPTDIPIRQSCGPADVPGIGPHPRRDEPTPVVYYEQAEPVRFNTEAPRETISYVAGDECVAPLDHPRNIVTIPHIDVSMDGLGGDAEKRCTQDSLQDQIPNLEVVEISSLPAWKGALQEIAQAGICGLDLETTGLDPLSSRARLAQLSLPSGRVYVADLWELDREGGSPIQDLGQLSERSNIKKVGHNLKFDLAFIQVSCGRRLHISNVFDTMLASQVCWAGYYASGEMVQTLRSIAKRHLGIDLPKELQASDWGAEFLSAEQIAYAARDAGVLLPLHDILQELLKRNGLEQIAELEFRVIPSVIELELRGLPLDVEACRAMIDEKRLQLQKITQNFQARGLNPNSPKQLLAFLQSQGYNIPSTKEESLKELVAAGCSFAEEILQYRRLAKQVKFLDDWLQRFSPIDGRLHSTYFQLSTRSGRFSSKNPNAQQIPKRGEDGQAMRRLFKAPPGKKIIKGDFSGIELRIMARLSQDKTMIEAFRAGQDLHKLTASRLAGVPIDRVTKEQRQSAKSANFGLIYGVSARRFRENAQIQYGVNMSQEEAEQIRNAFFATYPGVQAFHRTQKALKQHPQTYIFHNAEQGFYSTPMVCIQTISGRKRIWDWVNGQNLARDTMLYNSPSQGTGADLIKAVMAEVYNSLPEDVKMIGSVHDEILLEAPEASAKEIADLLLSIMRRVGSELLSPVPVDAEVEIMDSWGGS